LVQCFLLFSYFAGFAGAGCPGFPGVAGAASSGSWLKNVVAVQLASTVSFGFQV
jgi:hypothetical protein